MRIVGSRRGCRRSTRGPPGSESFSPVMAKPSVRIYTSSVPVLIPSVSKAGPRQVALLTSPLAGPGRNALSFSFSEGGDPFIRDSHSTATRSSVRSLQDKKVEMYSINFNEHIQEGEFKITIDHLDNQKENEIEEMIEEYKTVFAKDKYDIETDTDYEAHIDLLVDKYCSKRPYRCTIQDKKEIEEQISMLLKKNLIDESYSPFGAPVPLAFKKDENKRSRLCIRVE